MNFSDIIKIFKRPRESERALESEISSVASKKRRTDYQASQTNSEGVGEAAGTSVFDAVFPRIDDETRDDARTIGSVRSGRPRTTSTLTLCISERIDSLIKAIEGCSFTEEDLSNPESLLDLPYPSTIRKPPMCFDTHVRGSVSGVRYFRYMGREVVQDLLKLTREYADGTSSNGTYYLFGPPGSGKSHILAALACLLLHQGETVFYIPDCAKLWKDPIQLFKDILSLTYLDRQEDIQRVHDMDGLKNFVQTLRRTPTICIIDNIDVLREDSGDVETKRRLGSLIAMFSSNHFIIYGTTTRRLEASEARESLTKVLQGLSEREMKQWWTHFSTEMPSFRVAKDKKEVEYQTGRLPYLLRQMQPFAKEPYKSIRSKLMTCDAFMDLRQVISEVIRGMLADRSSSEHMSIVLHLEACVQGSTIGCAISTKFYDSRYFYFIDNIGHCSCGIVRDATTKVLLSQQPSILESQTWVAAALAGSTKNPSLRGYLVEMMCLSHISMRGLKNVAAELDAMPIIEFLTVPSWGRMVDAEPEVEEIWRRLYVPIAYNYEAIDGLIVMLNKKKRTLELFAIQVTIAAKHKDSEKPFFKTWWPRYYEAIPDRLKRRYKISIAFVWLHKGGYVTDKPMVIEESDRVKGCPSEYKLFKIPLKAIHSDFHKL